MKKMKRFLVALLSCLTAVACVAGISACGEDDKTSSSAPAPNSSSSAPADSSSDPADSSSDVADSSSDVADSSSDVADSSSDVADSSSDVEEHVCSFPVVESLAATCEEDGYTIYGACECGAEPEVAEEVVPALGHNYTYVDAKVPTCTEWGWDAYVGCDRCGLGNDTLVFDEYLPVRPEPAAFETVDEYVKAYNQWVIELNVYVTAKDAWMTKLDRLNPLGHKMVIGAVSAVPATCTSVGYTKGDKCSVCGFVENVVEVEMIAHVVTDVDAARVAPTCTTVGYEEVKGCVACDYQEGGEEIAALGHFHESLTHTEVAADAPDCVNVGYEAYKVCYCGYNTITEDTTAVDATVLKNIEVPALGHDMVIVVEGKAPVCATGTAGYTAATKCNREGCTHEVASVPVAAAHIFNLDAPTCTEAKVCEVCEYEAAAATGHSFTDTVTSVSATCTKEGLVVMGCSACDAVKVTTTKKVDHSWSQATQYKEATCQHGITKVNALDCATCDNYALVTNGKVTICTSISQIWSTQPTAHKKVSTWVDATCLKASTHNNCEYCGEEIESFKVAAKGHILTTAVSCTADGVCKRVNCDYKVNPDDASAVVPKYNHTYEVSDQNGANSGLTAWVDVAAKAATCTAAGYEAHKVCALCKDFADVSGKMEVVIGTDGTNNITVDVGTPNMDLTSNTCYFYVAPIGHDYKAVKGKIATCVEAGYSAYEECSICGTERGKTIIAKKSHASTWTGSCLDKVKCDCAYKDATGNWVGCGKYFNNAKKGECVYDADGYCVVCAECEHGVLKDIVCKKCEEDA